jgi:YwiC-like protein
MSELNSVTHNDAIANTGKPNLQAWYRPIFSPEHGVYVMLLVSFLTGVAATRSWTLATTLAFVCAFFGFQAEHPLMLQIKQRKSWKPRFVVWGSLYGFISLAIAVYLSSHSPILLWIYSGAVSALIIDAISIFYRQQKSVVNELITFAAICLAAPFAYAATTGVLSLTALGLWVLNTLFFASAIFTVKLRKPGKGIWQTAPMMPGLVYHAIAAAIVLILLGCGVLPLVTAVAFGVALLKLGGVLWHREWYRTAAIHWIAVLETVSAILFWAIASISYQLSVIG